MKIFSSVLHSLDRLQFATIDHHRGRTTRRQLNIDPKSSVRVAAGIAISDRYERIWKTLRDRAEDDRRLEAIVDGRPGGIDRRSGVGPDGDRANRRVAQHAAGASVKQNCI